MIAASRRGAFRRVAAMMLAALAAACATPPHDPAARAAFEQNNDPLEPMNRKILEANQFIDRILLRPVTKLYILVVPEGGRGAVHRALNNMTQPVVVINNVLQGSPRRAGIALGRFVANTTLGLGGLLDPAAKLGLQPQTGDFGQTLFTWGVPSGPYLITPLLGPSSPRDLLGMGADAYIDPFSFMATAEDLDQIQIIRFVLGGVDERAQVMDELDDLQKNSIDFYAQLRSLYQQHRAAELRHGKSQEPGASFYDIPAAAPGGAPATPAKP